MDVVDGDFLPALAAMLVEGGLQLRERARQLSRMLQADIAAEGGLFGKHRATDAFRAGIMQSYHLGCQHAFDFVPRPHASERADCGADPGLSSFCI